MQVAGVVDIQNMYSGKVPEITLEMVLLHCSNNSITFPIGIYKANKQYDLFLFALTSYEDA